MWWIRKFVGGSFSYTAAVVHVGIVNLELNFVELVQNKECVLEDVL